MKSISNVQELLDFLVNNTGLHNCLLRMSYTDSSASFTVHAHGISYVKSAGVLHITGITIRSGPNTIAADTVYISVENITSAVGWIQS